MPREKKIPIDIIIFDDPAKKLEEHPRGGYVYFLKLENFRMSDTHKEPLWNDFTEEKKTHAYL